MGIIERILTNFINSKGYEFTDEEIIDVLVEMGYTKEEVTYHINQIRKLKEINK